MITTYQAALDAFVMGKRARGQRAPEDAETAAVARTWAEAFDDNGVSGQQALDSAKRLIGYGESITLQNILKDCRSQVGAVAKDTDPAAMADAIDRRIYNSILDWAGRNRMCPRQWIDWDEYMEDHARKMGVLDDYPFEFMEWEKANAYKKWAYDRGGFAAHVPEHVKTDFELYWQDTQPTQKELNI